jgi:acetyl esterase
LDSAARAVYNAAMSTSLPGPFGALQVRAHAPADAQPSGLVFFHAGAATRTPFAASAAFCDALAAAAACHVLAVDSALIAAPEFPRSVDEAYFTVCHLHELAEDFGVDHRRLGVAGQGFGGTLATQVARLAKERRNPALPFELLIDPLLELRAPSPALAAFVQRYLPNEADRSDPRASPSVAKNLIGLPPTLVVTSQPDAQLEACDAYVAALARAYVPARVVHARGPAAAEEALSACAQAVRAALAG